MQEWPKSHLFLFVFCELHLMLKGKFTPRQKPTHDPRQLICAFFYSDKQHVQRSVVVHTNVMRLLLLL